ncbi:protocatechuate 3,4-dioxygenase alpha subunit [Kineococcus xinjiangensis]|uniref:Protocatechuate 3,4-dioxygenase alpha subunit n=1 Tax=Kineococcus xinjiangensis TaxID=512762 RepID=A0A2S6IP33_9ACTN|nr:protocatechuate 3,4-dioxygenase subunit alpha [Kineococcus xinjiangensis]PPK96017.1 protocatechuate 3,4-dioxygenase alpha subunit [Kineococcus xinjiangensis]
MSTTVARGGDGPDAAKLALTPSQTVGPYLAIGLTWADGPEIATAGLPGAFLLRGTLRDGAGDPVPDGMLEIWQADPDGRFDHPDDPRGAVVVPGFRGYGRCLTDTEGRFWFRTVKPGQVPDGDGGAQAPHLDVTVMARGLLDRLVTRIYFADEEPANAEDPVLRSLPEEVRGTLLARPAEGGYVFDVVLQGEGETAFFRL